jgi:MFS transporter, DHA2 family, multidrug resistance protein
MPIMTSLEQSQASFRPTVSPWLIAVAVTVPTFMEVLDCSITNVALGFISGELSAAKNDSEWVITSYLSANAIILPLSGWLSTYFGRRR